MKFNFLNNSSYPAIISSVLSQVTAYFSPGSCPHTTVLTVLFRTVHFVALSQAGQGQSLTKFLMVPLTTIMDPIW